MKTADVILLNQDHDRVTVLKVPLGKIMTASVVQWCGRYFVYQPANHFQLGFVYFVECDPPVDLTQEARL